MPTPTMETLGSCHLGRLRARTKFPLPVFREWRLFCHFTFGDGKGEIGRVVIVRSAQSRPLRC